MSKQTKTALDPLEIEQLISVYHSELRQLNYRVLSVRKNIEQLESALTKVSPNQRAKIVSAPPVVAKAAPQTASFQSATAYTGAAAAPAAPAIESSTSTAPKKVSMPEPVVVRRKRKLSPWDQFILTTLEEGDKVLIMSEFLEIVKENLAEAKGWTEAKIKSKLNAVFHKLANKKGSIVKVSFQGRGFAYALPRWLNPAGELKKKYRR